MKKFIISAATCEMEPVPEKPKELEFFLEEDDWTVRLKVRDKNDSSISPQVVLLISKETGEARRIGAISLLLGLPLDPLRRIKMTNE